MTTAAAAPTTASAPPAAAPASSSAPAAPAAVSPGAGADNTLSLLYPAGEPDPAPAAPAAGGDPAAEGKTDEPAPGDAPAADANVNADEETISSMDELTEHFQLDPEYFNSLKVTVKVNGETRSVPYAELVRNYQIGEAAEHRLEEAKSRAQVLTQGLAQKGEELQSHILAAAELVKHAEAVLEQEFKAVNWADLKKTDPAKYAADMRDFDDRKAQIKDLKTKGATAWQSVAAQRQAEAVEALKEKLTVERAALFEAFPTWKDAKTSAAERKKLVQYMTGPAKFTDVEVRNTVDHRLLVISHKAMQFDELQERKTDTLQRVKKIPKVLKGAPPAPPPPPRGETSIAEDLYGRPS